jgi:hypothetical protein
MVNDNVIEPNKITLLGWVDKALDQALTKKNIISRFRVIGIWPLNPNAMEEKTRFSNLFILYIITNVVCVCAYVRLLLFFSFISHVMRNKRLNELIVQRAAVINLLAEITQCQGYPIGWNSW